MLWQYRLLPLEGELAALLGLLDDLGAQGWELVGVNGGTAYFKRPLLRLPSEETPRVCGVCEAYAKQGENKETGVSFGICGEHGFTTQAHSEACPKWRQILVGDEVKTDG